MVRVWCVRVGERSLCGYLLNVSITIAIPCDRATNRQTDMPASTAASPAAKSLLVVGFAALRCGFDVVG